MLIGYIRRPERGDTFKKPPSCWLVLHGERKGEVLWISPEGQGGRFLGGREMVYRGWGSGEDIGDMVSRI